MENNSLNREENIKQQFIKYHVKNILIHLDWCIQAE